MKRLAPLCLAASALIAGHAAQAQNIVQDGGLEATPDFSPWNYQGWTREGAGQAHSGSHAAGTDCVGSGCTVYGGPGSASLSQQLATSSGVTYTLDFFVQNDYPAPSELAVYWNGQEVFDLTPLPVSTGWVEYSVSGLVGNLSRGLAGGAGATTELTFLGRQDPAALFLDDVSVVATGTVAAVPEPATTALMGAGLAALAWLRRRTVRRS